MNVARGRTRASLAVAMLVLPCTTAAAHDGRPLEPHDLAGAWSFEPWAITLLGISLGVYAVGTRRIARRTRRPRRGLEHGALFAAGWIVLALSLVSPVHALGEALLAAHMVQHELLMVVATPLLVLGRPLVPALWALPGRWRQPLGRAARGRGVQAIWSHATRPLIAALIHGAAIWLWHAPPLYEAGLRSDAAHAVQHAAFILTSLLFWWSVLRTRRAHFGEGIVALFVTALHTGALGALLTFGNSLWYSAYAATTGPWGFSPLQDQQLAGLIMWIPGGTVYLVVALWILGRWLAAPHGPRSACMIAG